LIFLVFSILSSIFSSISEFSIVRNKKLGELLTVKNPTLSPDQRNNYFLKNFYFTFSILRLKFLKSLEIWKY